jgi:hypothetical protein
MFSSFYLNTLIFILLHSLFYILQDLSNLISNLVFYYWSISNIFQKLPKNLDNHLFSSLFKVRFFPSIKWFYNCTISWCGHPWHTSCNRVIFVRFSNFFHTYNSPWPLCRIIFKSPYPLSSLVPRKFLKNSVDSWRPYYVYELSDFTQQFHY